MEPYEICSLDARSGARAVVAVVAWGDGAALLGLDGGRSGGSGLSCGGVGLNQF